MSDEFEGNEDDIEAYVEENPEAEEYVRGRAQSLTKSSSTPEFFVSDEDIKVGGKFQFAVGDGFYFPCGKTIERLPAGYYVVRVADGIGLHYQRLDLRTDELIRFPDQASDLVIDEVEKFWTCKDRYHALKVPHKRGYLLWGPPGSGKTATISFIIRDLVEKGYVIFQFNRLTQEGINKLRDIQAEKDRRVVVVMEDIDSLINENGEDCVLSLLDGETQYDNTLFLATTNYPQRLPARIRNRPSRFDRLTYIGMPNTSSRRLFIAKKLEAIPGGLYQPELKFPGVYTGSGNGVDGVEFSDTEKDYLKLAESIYARDEKTSLSSFEALAAKLTSGAIDNATVDKLRADKFFRRAVEDIAVSHKFVELLVEKTNGFSLAHIKEILVSVFALDLGLDETVDRMNKMRQSKESSDQYESELTGRRGVGF